MNIQDLTASIIKASQDELNAKINRLALCLDLSILQNDPVTASTLRRKIKELQNLTDPLKRLSGSV